MGRARDIASLLTTSSVLATDAEVASLGYLTNSTASSIYTPLSSPVTSYKNKIINGGFDIWQRGTSFSTNNVYSADRWIVGFATGSFTQAGFATGGNEIPGYEPRFYGRWTISSNSQNYELTQKIEGVRTFAGQTVTLSFWARISSGTVAFGPRIVQHFGTGGSPSSLVVTGISSQTVTSSWQRFSYTVLVPSISGKTIGTNNDDSLWISFQISNANTGAIDIWGVQLEKGSIATEFEQRHIADELRLCQRYYQRVSHLSAVTVTSTQVNAYSHLHTQMRVGPIIGQTGVLNVQGDNTNNNTQSSVGFGTNYSGVDFIYLTSVPNFSGLTAPRPVLLSLPENNGNVVTLTAEL
jgi:hypothetical protein